ncbi:hypothetical protein PEC18_03190 [Paucibacter sp. O1-1]|uniref:hypothetical protein n=1 Tax=unclassified Roseateles TaxID=2626991 RepID=UPI0014857381|nr:MULTISPECIES: hypothetical protein [unclassified Roseateles]MCU7369899.1 hypothetical protein [Paucibacter sp. O1-1]MCZ7884998.1 hypothetical protein [Paucibacter sp. M5-1]MDA3824884.1 hypothetical protein [Paucibacter sp. O1-1]MDC6168933.1 hypothetical protein [Paucibacter sp. XJ19-41]
MSRQHLNHWCAACWTLLRNGFGGASLSLAIQAQLPAQMPVAVQPGALLTGEQP